MRHNEIILKCLTRLEVLRNKFQMQQYLISSSLPILNTTTNLSQFSYHQLEFKILFLLEIIHRSPHYAGLPHQTSSSWIIPGSLIDLLLLPTQQPPARHCSIKQISQSTQNKTNPLWLTLRVSPAPYRFVNHKCFKRNLVRNCCCWFASVSLSDKLPVTVRGCDRQRINLST